VVVIPARDKERAKGTCFERKMHWVNQKQKEQEKHLRSGMLDRFPSDNESQQVEAPVLESGQVLLCVLQRKGSANERDFSPVRVEKALGLV